MKLNPDCIRDLLFAIEEQSSPNNLIVSSNLANLDSLSKYSNDEIIYHLRQLNWGGYIICPSNHNSFDDYFFITDLSPLGHEFISAVRKDTNWNKVKTISKEVGTSTISSLKTIAEEIITSAIKTSLGLN